MLLSVPDGDPLVVTSILDTVASDGVRALREAIAFANSHSGLDTITFNIPGSGVHTITPIAQLPRTITDPVVIDGYTQPGASPNSNGPGLSDNAVPLIEINGAIFYEQWQWSDNRGWHNGSTVRGLVIDNGSSTGVLVQSQNTVIEGNFLGTDPTGLVPRDPWFS